MSETILNFTGKGKVNQYVFRNIPPTTLSEYDTTMILSYFLDENNNEIITITIQNEVIVRVSMTVAQNLFTPDGFFVAYQASRNEINYNFYFKENFAQAVVQYTGSTNNATQIATYEEYELVAK